MLERPLDGYECCVRSHPHEGSTTGAFVLQVVGCHRKPFDPQLRCSNLARDVNHTFGQIRGNIDSAVEENGCGPLVSCCAKTPYEAICKKLLNTTLEAHHCNCHRSPEARKYGWLFLQSRQEYHADIPVSGLLPVCLVVVWPRREII